MTTRALLRWLDEPRAGTGIRFAADDAHEWDFWSYERLAALTRSAASGLIEEGVGPGDRVTVILPSGPHFVATFFGAMLAGAVPSPSPRRWSSRTRTVTTSTRAP